MSDSMASCRTLKQSLLDFLGGRVEVSFEEGACLVTLPLKTLDNRYITVYVEQTATNRLQVHDGGDTVAELFLQGMNLTNSRAEVLRAIAKRYGVSFADNSFMTWAAPGLVNEAILTIAQCATSGMHDILKHAPASDEERVTTLVKKTLLANPPRDTHVQIGAEVKGGSGRNHKFDAVVVPFEMATRQIVTVKALPVSHPPHLLADSLLGLSLDLKNTPYGRWRKLTVVPRAERWPREHLDAVREVSDDTILLTGDDDSVAEMLVPRIEKLASVA